MNMTTVYFEQLISGLVKAEVYSEEEIQGILIAELAKSIVRGSQKTGLGKKCIDNMLKEANKYTKKSVDALLKLKEAGNEKGICN